MRPHSGQGRHSPAVSLTLALLGLALSVPLGSGAARAQTVGELRDMSIEQLANLDVTSVSKRAEPLSDAPAAIYVITHDDIVRSGATSIPEILRLAPNLQVAMITASSYAITARGFNGNAADKLLVLIDGRSVYTPLFGGVLWDEQFVLPENIERIEVISGPGATLWGANAVNGVINIITRKSGDTQGGVLQAYAGNREHGGSAQFGGKISSDLTYRAYVDASSTPHDKVSTGADALDGWTRVQGGFRMDWTPASDAVTLQGAIYDAHEQQAGPDLDLLGGHVQVNWQRQLGADSSFQLLAYVDESSRYTGDIAGYTLGTYDIEAQHSFSLGSRQQIVWGLGGRIYQDSFKNIQPVVYLPASSVEGLGDGFIQDSITLAKPLVLTLGLKLEKDPYAGVSPLPNVRLAWKVGKDALLWAAVSRAVRAPTLFDEDINDTIIPGVLILTGNPAFKPEKLLAYEAGARTALGDKASISVSAYYNVYDDLRSTEWANMTTLPLLWIWGNLMDGHTYGVEVWGDYRPWDWWRLSAGLKAQHEDLRFKPNASTLNNVAEAGDDPNLQGSLRSSMSLGHGLSWTADLRYVDALPNPVVPRYTELDTSLVWAASKRVQVSISGFNLLHAHHVEYEIAGATTGDEVERSFSVGLRVGF